MMSKLIRVFILVWGGILFVTSVCYADFLYEFKDTRPTSKTIDHYTKKNVKGLKVVRIDLFSDRIYPIFVCKEDLTTFQFRIDKKYIVDTGIGNSNVWKLIKPKGKGKGLKRDYVSIQAHPDSKIGDHASFRVIMNGNFSANFMVYVTSRRYFNNIINIYDGKKLAKSIPNSIEYLEATVRSLKVENQDLIDGYFHLTTEPMKLVPIDKETKIDKKGTKVILKNIIHGNGSYLYTLELVGHGDLKLVHDDILLKITNYENPVLFFGKGDEIGSADLKPKRIIFNKNGEKQYATIEFEVPSEDRQPYFVSRLHLSPLTYIENEVNFASFQQDDNQFFTSPVNQE
jgi:hypothetical protein